MSVQHSPRRRSLSWSKKLGFAALTTLGFFVVLELALACLRVEPLTRSGDPFVGFSRRVPLFVPQEQAAAQGGDSTGDDGQRGDAGGTWMQTAPGKLVWFNPQAFPSEKPAGTRRVFCLGGSTTYGRPFADSTSFCGWLRRFLPLVDAEHSWEVINAGGISYASYRVVAVMEELAQYEPDLFIVLSGHNEFLERRTYASMFEQDAVSREMEGLLQTTRTWAAISQLVGRNVQAEVEAKETLPEEVDEILNHSAGPQDYHRDDVWAGKVTSHYEYNLERMVRIARDAGAEIVLLTPVSNLRDCSPFKSEPAASLSDEQRDEMLAMLDLIESELREDRFQQSVELAEPLVEVDPRNARAQYLFGKALFGLQRREEAEQAFRRALDEDICPLRATSAITSKVRQVAQRHGVLHVDLERLLEQRSRSEGGHACFGSDYFLDHVHPTIDVHRQIALWVLDELRRGGWLQGEEITGSQMADVQQAVEAEIDTVVQGVAFRNLAKVLHWAGKFDEAAPRARDAIRLLPDDLESRAVLADCMKQTGRPDEALALYRELYAIGDYPRSYVPYAELLADRGDLVEAKSYLMRALLDERDDYRARAHYSLGLVHLQLGEFDFAAQSLRESDRLYPEDPATICLIAEAELARGDGEAAIQELKRVVEIAPDNFYAHFRLAEILAERKQFREAAEHIDTAVRLEPLNADARARQQMIQESLPSAIEGSLDR